MKLNLKISVLLVLMVLPLSAFAQKKYAVKAVLEDANTKEKMSFVTVVLAKPGAEKPSAYALSEDDGSLNITDMRPATYILKAEYMGYKVLEHTFEIKDKDVDLGILKMEPSAEVLGAAKVSAVGNPIQMKQDTISFTASSVKTTENDMLEDLLKKIPGMEVSEDGSITHNGRTIDKITIDGKTFFLDDPQLASKNLPAKIIDKVKVIEKKSDQAQFTGIDDGEEETVIDLSVKPGMMKGMFGNATLGGGHDVPADNIAGDYRYQGAAFVGRFTDDNQISIILNGNNTNNRGFRDISGGMMGNMRGMMGGGQGGWGRGNGITTSYMGGINGGANLLNNKMELSGNYLYNHTQKDIEESSTQTTYLEDSNLLYDTQGTSTTSTGGHRFGMRLEHKFSENTSIIFEPQINFGGGDYFESSEDFTKTFKTAENKTFDTNSSTKTSSGSNKNLNANGFALLRQKLFVPGQTLTVMGSYSVSTNSLKGFNNSTTNIFNEDGSLNKKDEVNQTFDQNQNSYSVWGRGTFTQPLGGNFYLEANYSLTYAKSESEKVTTDSEGVIVDNYSNKIYNDNLNQNIGFNALYQGKGYRFQVGLAAMPTKLHNYTASGSAYKVDTTITRLNWSPNVMATFDIGENGSFRMFYHGHTRQPSTSQLITVADNSNPLAVSFGNPNLAPYFSHDMRGDFRYNNKQTYASVNARWDLSYYDNPIVNGTWYTNGIAYTMPMNGPSRLSANFNVYMNIPIKKSGFTFMNMTRLGWSSSASYVGSDIDTGKYINGDDGSLNYKLFFADYDEIRGKFTENTTKTFSMTERLSGKYRNDDLEVELSARTRMNSSWYTVGTVKDNTLTFNNQIRATATWTWDLIGLNTKGTFNYNWYNGYATKQPSEYVLNIEIEKMILNKKATLALKGFDILGQSKNLTVTDASNYHKETVNNTLGRYIILSFTYRFGNFGGGGNRGMRGPGGPGGPRH